jgi:RNA polymerase sigma-70 factor (ECF subfamily)
MTGEDFRIEVFPLKDKIFRFARRLMTVHADAEDVTQEVFLKLWNKKTELKSISNIEAYAITMTRNVCIDRMRTAKAPMTSLEGPDIRSAQPDPLDRADQAYSRRLVHQIIGRLPVQQKMILQLRDIEGYEYDEIARVMELNVNTVRVNLSRARKAVKDELVKLNNHGLGTN